MQIKLAAQSAERNSNVDKYEELVDLLEEVGILQLQDDWAVEIQELIELHKTDESGASE